jgi:hypothetical protein
LERELNGKFSGNEVYYTNALILLIKIILYSKLHDQRGFNLILFSYDPWQALTATTLFSSFFFITLEPRVE